jgi:glutamyl-tRNA synthetase
MLALNADHIKAAAPEALVPHLTPFLVERGIADPDPAYLAAAIETLQTRSKTLLEMADGALFYFQAPAAYDPQAVEKFFKPALREPLHLLIAHLEQAADFTESAIEAAFLQTMEAAGLKLGKLAQPVRVALTGKTVSPGIFEIIRVLGQAETLSRLRKAAATITPAAD